MHGEIGTPKAFDISFDSFLVGAKTVALAGWFL